MTVKPARIAGTIPAGYTGPIFYRMSNYSKPWPPSNVLSDYLKFPGRDVRATNRIVSLGSRNAIIDRSTFTSYVDDQGNVEAEWSTPIRAVTKANYKEQWPEFSFAPITLVSERVKEIIEKYERQDHAFVAMDVESSKGDFLSRVFVMVRGVALDAVDYIASSIVPVKVYPGGKASWEVTVALPRDEFAYLHREKVQGLHHFWDEKLQHVWSQEVVAELGDVLPKEYVFVPMGVTG